MQVRGRYPGLFLMLIMGITVLALACTSEATPTPETPAGAVDSTPTTEPEPAETEAPTQEPAATDAVTPTTEPAATAEPTPTEAAPEPPLPLNPPLLNRR
jgi:eukaryotic-like serine/threonine-protein kinase